jgi:hypothetical protein
MRKMKRFEATAVLVALLTLPAVNPLAAGLPDPGMVIDPENTALVVTDPQNDFLSPEGVTWGVVGASVTANGTVEHIDALFKTAKKVGIPVFVSPHYYFPTDHGWQFEGALEKLMHNIGMFDRKGPLSLDGFSGSGADWPPRYKKYIQSKKLDNHARDDPAHPSDPVSARDPGGRPRCRCRRGVDTG